MKLVKNKHFPLSMYFGKKHYRMSRTAITLGEAKKAAIKFRKNQLNTRIAKWTGDPEWGNFLIYTR
jgi:hypothetical protein